jgi:CheY-like chemotaxis protein
VLKEIAFWLEDFAAFERQLAAMRCGLWPIDARLSRQPDTVWGWSGTVAATAPNRDYQPRELNGQVASGRGKPIPSPDFWPLAGDRLGAAKEESFVLAPPMGQVEWVLLVDDDEDLRKVVSRALEKRGYRVLVAGGGAEAMKLLKEYRGAIRVAITDMRMPGMDGEATIQALREIDPKVKIIAVSGLPMESSEVGGLAVSACLLKPFTIVQMLRTLATVWRAD